MKPFPQTTDQPTAIKPAKRWFRLKFADGRIDGTDWDSAEQAEETRQWYLANMPHVAKYAEAVVIELTPAQKAELHYKAVAGVIGHHNAAIFLGGVR